jgi:hypothetical protein
VVVTASTHPVIRQHRFERTDCSGRHWIAKVDASPVFAGNAYFTFVSAFSSWEEWLKKVAVFLIEDG